MSLTNTSRSYGSLHRSLHWLTALFILSAIVLGLVADALPVGSDAEFGRVATLYSLHKTIGLAAFFTALVRILWVIVQPHPAQLHPDRRVETFAAVVVHWALYGAMLVMPLSGWIHHAATTGFAPIWWPFGQSLPFVPQSEAVAHTGEVIHRLSANVLYVAIGLHVVGALKHVVIDRDETLARMTRGVPGGPVAPADGHGAGLKSGLGTALVLWVAVLGYGLFDSARSAPAPGTAATAAAEGGNWEVSEGTLDIVVRQMGAEVSGRFAGWTAAIDYDEAARTGAVRVEIEVGSLTLGSVTQQALAADFFDADAFPQAVFEGEIAPAPTGPEAAHLAEGMLSLRGVEVPVTLDFTLEIEGDVARMEGFALLDRRDFGMGESYGDESTVGFPVRVDVNLTATRR